MNALDSIINISSDLTNGVFKGFKAVTMFLFNLVISSAGSYEWLESVLCFSNGDIDVVGKVWNYLAPLSITILIIGFLFELQEVAFRMQGNEVFKEFIKPFFKLLAGYTIIANGATITGWILGFNNWWIKTCQDITLTTTLDKTASGSITGFEEAINQMGLYEHLFCWIGLLIVWVIQMVPAIVIFYNAFARKLEVIMRVSLLPISCGDIFSRDVWNSNGIRYIKKILALGLYGGAMILILKTVSILQTTYMAEQLGNIELNIATGQASDMSAFMQGISMSANQLWMGSGVGTLVGVFFLIKILIFSAMILMAGVGACSMTKQACNDVLGC